MLKKLYSIIFLIGFLISPCAFAANILDVKTVTGTAAKTIDGSLNDWAAGEKILTRANFLPPAFTGWTAADSGVKMDVYASVASNHLYIAVDINSISTTLAAANDFGYSGVEVYLLTDKARQDKYCWQVIAHYQNRGP